MDVSSFQVGDIITGKVTGIKDYGIFVKPIDYPMSTRKVESLQLIAMM